jgi:hypothetical protein
LTINHSKKSQSGWEYRSQRREDFSAHLEINLISHLAHVLLGLKNRETFSQ